jgi:hypothetical protein
VGGGAAEFQGGFGGDGFNVGGAADAVRAEDFLGFAHGLVLGAEMMILGSGLGGGVS